MKKYIVGLTSEERSQLREIVKTIPVEPGQPHGVDAEYRRCGTGSVFMLNAPLEGKRYIRVCEHRTRKDFAEIIGELCDELYRKVDKIVLVLDQLNTHNTASLYQAFAPAEAKRLADRLELHHTAKHGSWLNMAEIELSILSRQCMND